MMSDRLDVDTAAVKSIVLRVLAISGVTVVAVGGTYASVRLFGILDTVIYLMLFASGVSLIPILVYMYLPRSITTFQGPIGMLSFSLGMVAFGEGYLVETNHGYRMCPGTTEKYYFDGEWYDIAGGEGNRSILGFRPFGMLRHKDGGAFESVQISEAEDATPSVEEIATDGLDIALSDGGEQSTGIVRGDVAEVRPRRVDGWLIDLKHYYSRGIQKMGDISVIEDAEAIAERGEAEESRMDNLGVISGVLGGLLLGVGGGIAYIAVMG